MHMMMMMMIISKNKTPSISYKILQPRMLYTTPKRGSIVPSYVEVHGLKKGEDDHCWMKANRCLSAPSDLPVMPSYWLLSIATTSRRISYNNVA